MPHSAAWQMYTALWDQCYAARFLLAEKLIEDLQEEQQQQAASELERENQQQQIVEEMLANCKCFCPRELFMLAATSSCTTISSPSSC